MYSYIVHSVYNPHCTRHYTVHTYSTYFVSIISVRISPIYSMPATLSIVSRTDAASTMSRTGTVLM